MCIEHGLNRQGFIGLTRNRDVVTHTDKENRDGSIEATAIASADPNTPVGTKIVYSNKMGHVMCDGNDRDHQHHCELHDLDCVEYASHDEIVDIARRGATQAAAQLEAVKVVSKATVEAAAAA